MTRKKDRHKMSAFLFLPNRESLTNSPSFPIGNLLFVQMLIDNKSFGYVENM